MLILNYNAFNMDKYLSFKLKVTSFFLIVLIVYIHASDASLKTYASEAALGHQAYNSFIQYFIANGIARIAVPLFFLISSFLFFLNFNLNGYSKKIESRLKTLLIPYLFWNTFCLLLCLLIQQLTTSKGFFTGTEIANYSVYKVLDLIIVHPILYPLWFIRDLFLLVLISPLILFLAKIFKQYLLLFFVAAWVLNINLFIPNEAFLFFVSGLFLAQYHRQWVEYKSPRGAVLLTLLWVIMLLAETHLVLSSYENSILINILHKVGILIGIISVWRLFDFFFQKNKGDSEKYMSTSLATFFIYVFHEPLLTLLKVFAIRLASHREPVLLASYLVIPIITVAICLIIAKSLRIFPRFYHLITGNR